MSAMTNLRSVDLRIRPARPDEAPALAGVLTEAFQRDPLAGWFYPDPDERRAAHGDMFARTLDHAFSAAFPVETTDALDAVAIWQPPGEAPDLTPPPGAQVATRELFAALSAAAPVEPFWYLLFIGARTGGRGAGGALMRHRLTRVDGRAALWTGNAANLPFYERHGFTIASRHDVQGASTWWLVRNSD